MAECPEGASGTVTVTDEVTESPTVSKTFDVFNSSRGWPGGREISVIVSIVCFKLISFVGFKINRGDSN